MGPKQIIIDLVESSSASLLSSDEDEVDKLDLQQNTGAQPIDSQQPVASSSSANVVSPEASSVVDLVSSEEDSVIDFHEKSKAPVSASESLRSFETHCQGVAPPFGRVNDHGRTSSASSTTGQLIEIFTLESSGDEDEESEEGDQGSHVETANLGQQKLRSQADHAPFSIVKGQTSLHRENIIPSRATITQNYASVKSGSFHRQFSSTPNFFELSEAPDNVNSFIKFCRGQQIRTVKNLEKQHAVAYNRACVITRANLSSQRFNQVNVFSSISSIAPDVERYPGRDGKKLWIRKDYQRLCDAGHEGTETKKKAAGKAKPRTSNSSEFRSFPVAEYPIAFVASNPCYSAWIPLQRPISCADDPLLRYVCYFGENDYEDVMADVYEVENVDTQGKNKSQEHLAELYELDDAIIEQYLVCFALDRQLKADELRELEKALSLGSLAPTSGGARGPRDTAEPDANESFAARCLRLLKGLRKRMCLPAAALPKRTRNSEMEMIDTFRSLFCRICFVYDCQLHGAPDIPDEYSRSLWSVQCSWLENKLLEKAKQHGIIWEQPFRQSDEEKVDETDICEDGHLFAKAYVVSEGSLADTSKLLKGIASPKDIAGVLSKFPCGLSSSAREAFADNDWSDEIVCHLDTLSTGRVKQILSRRDFLTQFLKSVSNSETSKRLISESKRGLLSQSANTPCYHFGPCTEANGCSCAMAGNYCSKHCMCSVYCVKPTSSSAVAFICKNFFPGCRCTAGCETKSCPCFSSSRTCDPDLCMTCRCSTEKHTVIETLPVNQVQDGDDQDAEVEVITEREDDIQLQKKHLASGSAVAAPNPGTTTTLGSGPPEKKACQNGLHDMEHLLLAESSVDGAGWGIFARTAIPQGKKIAEYLGEIVSQEEAERRGRYYDKVNRSYLFNVNADQVVDAFRKGNKIKFANHSKKPNCEVKILNVYRQQHIVFFAKRDIEPGEELFFDYHYDQEQNSAYVKKNGVVVEWMRDGKRANSIRKRPIESQLISKGGGDTARDTKKKRAGTEK